MPRSHNEEHFVVVRVLGLNCLVDGDVAVDILLVPETMDHHHRHLKRLCGQYLVYCLVAPERVVARMLEKLPPETNLFESAATAELAGGTRLHKHVVVVKVARPPPYVISAR